MPSFATLPDRAGPRRGIFPQAWPAAAAIIALALVFSAGRLAAQTAEDTNSPAELKKLSVEQLMDIEVTSVSRSPEKLLDSPSAIQVVTGDEIRRAGATSIPEALRLADNLEVAQENSHDWHISARGFNTDLANKLLVMIDGRTVYTPLFSGVFWDVQDYMLEDVDRIEVISGPGGTLWGANAVNGVISIVSKSAKDTQGLYVEGGGGSELREFAGVRYGGMLASNVYFRIYGKYDNRGNEEFGNGNPASDSSLMGQGGFRMDAEMSANNTFTLQGDLYGANDNEVAGGKAVSGGGNLLGRWSHVISDDSDMSLQFYYDRTQLTDPVAAFVLGTNTLAPPGQLTDALDTYDFDFQHRFLIFERNHITWGLGYRFTHDVVGNTAGLSFFPAILNQNLFSGFVQDEISLWRGASFTLGTKIEHNDYTHFEYEPSARVQWNFITNQTVWAAVSRAVRAPSRIDHDVSEPAPPLVILRGDQDFESENVIAYEIGHRAQFGSKISTSIAAYYNDYNDIRSTSFTPTNIIPFFFQNNLQGHTYGVELSGGYQLLDWWRWHGGYDYLKEDLHVKDGQFDLNGALNETADPQQQFSVRSSMDLPANTEFDAGLRWVDTLHNNNGAVSGTVPSYFELDSRIAWRPSKWLELSIVGQNLLHEHHPEYGFPSPNRVEIGRSIYGKIACRF